MSDLHLYRVDWSGECYVMARSEREAEQIACDELGWAGEDLGICLDASEEDMKTCTPSPEWMDSIPYGNADDRTLGEILKEARDDEQ
jgi:hypothetical protein